MSDKWLTRSLWITALRLWKEAEKRGEKLGRYKLSDALQITEARARLLVAMLENQPILKLEPQEYKVEGKELIIADLHIPYHDELAVETALSVGEEENVSTITILGDLLDLYKNSHFPKNPEKKNVKDEITEAKQFLKELRNRFPKARIIYYEGNHEVRMQRYLWKRAPEIYALIENLLPNILELEKLGIEWVTDPFRIGKLWHLHGHEKHSRGNPLYITNVFMRIILDHFICGHFHRKEEKVFKRIDGSELWAGVVGMLATPEALEYAKINDFTQGFAVINYMNNGFFKARIHTIKDGEVF